MKLICLLNTAKCYLLFVAPRIARTLNLSMPPNRVLKGTCVGRQFERPICHEPG